MHRVTDMCKRVRSGKYSTQSEFYLGGVIQKYGRYVIQADLTLLRHSSLIRPILLYRHVRILYFFLYRPISIIDRFIKTHFY